MSTCDMIHPPNMSPFWFESAGIGTTRNAGTRPLGSRRPRGWCDALPMVGRRLLVLGEPVQRAAPERGKAGAEDQASVDQVGVRDDSFLVHGLSLGEVRGDQRLRSLRGDWVGRALDRLAVLPAVDSLPGLLAELLRGDLVEQHLRC